MLKPNKTMSTLKNEIDATPDGSFLTTTEGHLVFKKVYVKDGRWETPVVALMEIPAGTTVFVGFRSSYSKSRKCRAEEAIVHGLFYRDETPCFVPVAESMHAPRFRYWAGKIARPTEKFSQIRDECQSGIHFFTTFEEAKNY